MARIVLSTSGTLGDTLPFFALGKGLQARGYQVVLAINPALQSLAENAGLKAVPCGKAYGPAQARTSLNLPDATEQEVLEQKKWEARLTNVPAKYRDLEAACAEADLLVAHSYHYAALLVHNQTKKPWVCVSFTPGQYEHYDHPLMDQPAPLATLNLLASSMHFSQPNLDANTQVAVTGFWFADDAEPADWQPSHEQRAFVESGERPLVLCLGHLPQPFAEDQVTLHVEAASKLGRKLVVQKGWSEFDTDMAMERADPRQVLMTDFVSHTWLFARAEAIFHPGSLGVTALALRYGCPMLVEPIRRDQFFHALRVRALGVGSAMKPEQLSADAIARMTEEPLRIDEVRDRVQELSEMIRGEDGLGTACGHVEDLLKRVQR